jgi:hypothetical protein
MANPEAREWVQSAQPESVSRNRRRAMQSNLFAGGAPAPLPRAPAPTAPLQHSNSIRRPEVPFLPPFPEIPAGVPAIGPAFDLALRPRQPPAGRALRRLTFAVTDEMKRLRCDVERDFEDFSTRMKKLQSNEPLNFGERVQGHAGAAGPTKSVASEQAAGAPFSVLRTEEKGDAEFMADSPFLLPGGSRYKSSSPAA